MARWHRNDESFDLTSDELVKDFTKNGMVPIYLIVLLRVRREIEQTPPREFCVNRIYSDWDLDRCVHGCIIYPVLEMWRAMSVDRLPCIRVEDMCTTELVHTEM